MLYLLNTVLGLVVLCCCVKRREYRYTFISLLTFLYYVFSALQVDIDVFDNTQIYGLLQRLTLVVLAVYTIATAKKSTDKKLDIPAAVFASVACVFRLVRTYLFRSFAATMKLDATGTRILYDRFMRYYVPVDSVVNISLLIVLCCIAWKLRTAQSN